MGITPLTLGLASLRDMEIPDHKSGQMVKVRVAYINKLPSFSLVYPNGFICAVKWQDGQGVPGYCDGVIPFIKGGHYKKEGEKPSACLHK